MIRPPSASNLDRVNACPVSHTLPQIKRTTIHADRGTAKHRYIATGELPADPELREMCEVLDRERLPTNPEEVAAEVTFAWDYGTGAARELGRMLERSYTDAKETEFIGTADVVTLEGDDTVVIIDFKTGHSRKTPAARALQLRFLAFAAAQVYGRSRAKVAHCNLSDDGEPYWDWAELDAFELEATGVLLRKLMKRVADPGQPRPGTHCKYCPAFQSCPAQVGLLREVVAAPGKLEAEIVNLLTPETAALAYERLRQVQEVLKHVNNALHAYAAEHPIPLGDGMVFGQTTTAREAVKGDVAYRVLAEKYGPDVALTACEMSASKASIERALKPIAAHAGLPLAPLKREVLAELGAAGGLETKVAVSIKEHKPK